MQKAISLFCIVLIASLSITISSCTEEDSPVGVGLQDPSTIFDGLRDTAFGVAYTVFDDSLLTSGQSSGMVGCYSDDVFGNSEAIIYAQVLTPNNSSVDFDEHCIIDSVVLSLALTKVYSNEAKSYKNLHFEIYRLAEGLSKDSLYYSTDEIPVTSECLFNGVVRVPESDTMVAHIKLDNRVLSYFVMKSYANADEFAEAFKGLRIRLVNDGTPMMATVNFAAAATRLSLYYAYVADTQYTYRYYDFTVGHDATHFMQFKNNYTGVLSTFNSNVNDSLLGTRYLYLSPMGGTNIKLYFDNFITQFKQQHPYAVIHSAELVLPVADISPVDKPGYIAAFKCYLDGTVVSIPDMYDNYSGYGGKYDEQTNSFRLRITRHLQKMLTSGMDLGTLLVIDSRRSVPSHSVFNGFDATATSGDPIRIEFIYSE
ncbi:MAG: DUF4270 family protein [Bacteroidales bacterium]|nr:DUF4270 family protein [Bacteroidales bacterium]